MEIGGDPGVAKCTTDFKSHHSGMEILVVGSRILEVVALNRTIVGWKLADKLTAKVILAALDRTIVGWKAPAGGSGSARMARTLNRTIVGWKSIRFISTRNGSRPLNRTIVGWK